MISHNFCLRPVHSADIELLLELMKHFYRDEELPFDKGGARKAVEELMTTPAFGTIFLLLADEEVIGYLVAIQSFILEFGGRQTFLDELFIVEKWRGRGFGRQALTAVEVYARESGCCALRLEASRKNARALAMYERAGFEKHDRFTMTKVL
ncbi:MAG: GNAT family N-acetyltransferase [Verrucomicrobiaceae bacterium]|nr:MAG: GNAT family N-acetyltransferase [Verrucomicrobiaceae bacterium]